MTLLPPRGQTKLPASLKEEQVKWQLLFNDQYKLFIQTKKRGAFSQYYELFHFANAIHYFHLNTDI